jgi:hypothetical protein
MRTTVTLTSGGRTLRQNARSPSALYASLTVVVKVVLWVCTRLLGKSNADALSVLRARCRNFSAFRGSSMEPEGVAIEVQDGSRSQRSLCGHWQLVVMAVGGLVFVGVCERCDVSSDGVPSLACTAHGSSALGHSE